MRRLKEVNLVCSLKLIWRILSANSLWVNWIKVYLIRKGSLWSIKDKTQAGSWMWRKILKCREVAKKLYRVEIKNGKKTFFWYESWSSLGCLKDFLCDRGYIDMEKEDSIEILFSIELKRKLIDIKPILQRKKMYLYGKMERDVTRIVFH